MVQPDGPLVAVERDYPIPKYGVMSGEQPPSPINGIGVDMLAHTVKEGSKPSSPKEGSCGGGGGSSADAGVAKNNKPAVATPAAAKIVRVIDRSYQLGGSLIESRSARLPDPEIWVMSGVQPPTPTNGIGVVVLAQTVKEGSKPIEAKEGSCGGGGGGSSAAAGEAKINRPAAAAPAPAKIVRIIDRSYQLGGPLIITPVPRALPAEPQRLPRVA